MTPEERKHLEDRVIDMLRTIYDPEIPVDIYELGLIYEVTSVILTTMPACTSR
jgi:metal-sulfur cluster biosynthetic enzyme